MISANSPSRISLPLPRRRHRLHLLRTAPPSLQSQQPQRDAMVRRELAHLRLQRTLTLEEDWPPVPEIRQTHSIPWHRAQSDDEAA